MTATKGRPGAAHRATLAARRLLRVGDVQGMVSVRAEDLAALEGHLEAVASGTGHGVPGVRGLDGDRYDVAASIWRRSPYGGCPDGEWVLELSGAINDTFFTSRHTQPITCAPEDVAGLRTLYDALDAGTAEPDAGWTVRDPAYLAGVTRGLSLSAGIASRHAREAKEAVPDLDAIVGEIEAAALRAWDVSRDGAHPRHDEFDMDDVEVAANTFRSINPGRRMSEETVARMLDAVFARRAPLFEALRDSRAVAIASLERVTRAIARERDVDEARRDAFDAMRAALGRCARLLPLLRREQVVEAGADACEAAGLSREPTKPNAFRTPSTDTLGQAPVPLGWLRSAIDGADASADAATDAPSP